MSDFSTNESRSDDPETAINIRVAERQLEETDAVWKEEGSSHGASSYDTRSAT